MAYYSVITGARRQIREEKEQRELERRYFIAEQLRLRICPICTYSLIGNESGVCPECGTKLSDLLK